MDFLVLLFPIVILLLFFLAIVSLFFKNKRISLCLFVFALIVNFYSETFAFSSIETKGNSKYIVKVLAFNIHAAGNDFCTKYEKITKIIESTNCDLVLIIEFSTQYDDYDLLFDSLMLKKYPYSSLNNFSQDDIVLYSKFPIISCDSIRVENNYHFPLFQIDIHDKQFSLIGCHFASNNYVDSIRRMELDSLKGATDFLSYYKAIKKGYEKRREEVDTVSSEIKTVSYPINRMLVLGDFNDIGGSYTLKEIEKLGLKDAWWEGGLGFGGTRDVGIFAFRLDHILYGSDFELRDIRIMDSKGMSDHKALCASFHIN